MMVWFEGNLTLSAVRGEDGFYVVREPLVCHWVEQERSGTVTVPERFITDLASIPSALWPVLSPWGAGIREAALVHDRVYESHEYSREFADALLYYGMRALPSTAAERWAVWLGVRAGGYWSYKSGPERQQERLKKLQDLNLFGELP